MSGQPTKLCNGVGQVAAKIPVTLRAIVELLKSSAGDEGFLDAPLGIMIEDGNRNCEIVALDNLGWHHLPRLDHGDGFGGKVLRLSVNLNEHRLVKKRKEGGK